jgi:hypothetical protein
MARGGGGVRVVSNSIDRPLNTLHFRRLKTLRLAHWEKKSARNPTFCLIYDRKNAPLTNIYIFKRE